MFRWTIWLAGRITRRSTTDFREYPKRDGRVYRPHPKTDASPDTREPVRFRPDGLQEERKKITPVIKEDP